MEAVATTFIILTYNNPHYIKKCISCLQNQTIEEWNAIVLDASSEKKIQEVVKTINDKRIEHRPYSNSSGYAEKNNFVISMLLKKKAKPQYICLLNDDAFISPSFIKDFLTAEKQFKTGGIFSPLYIYNDTPNIIQIAGGGYFLNNLDTKDCIFARRDITKLTANELEELNTVKKIDYGYGAAIFYKTEVFEKIGLLDSSFIHGFDEPDMAKRAKLFGYDTIYFPSKVLHVSGGNSKSKNHLSFLKRFYLQMCMERGCFYFMIKHYPFSVAIGLEIKKVRFELKSILLKTYSILWNLAFYHRTIREKVKIYNKEKNNCR